MTKDDEEVYVKTEEEDEGGRYKDKVDGGDTEDFSGRSLSPCLELRTSRTSGHVSVYNLYWATQRSQWTRPSEYRTADCAAVRYPGCWRHQLLHSDAPGLAGC